MQGAEAGAGGREEVHATGPQAGRPRHDALNFAHVRRAIQRRCAGGAAAGSGCIEWLFDDVKAVPLEGSVHEFCEGHAAAHVESRNVLQQLFVGGLTLGIEESGSRMHLLSAIVLSIAFVVIQAVAEPYGDYRVHRRA